MIHGWPVSAAVVAMATTPEATTRAEVSLTGLGNLNHVDSAMAEILPTRSDLWTSQGAPRQHAPRAGHSRDGGGGERRVARSSWETVIVAPVGGRHDEAVKTGRLEAFSDAVIAILITIMVLELKIPHGTTLHALRPLLPIGLTYVLSFVYLGIYWNNHHHMLQVTEHVNGTILWANLHLLFWLSLVPVTTGWMGENGFAVLPTVAYGTDLLLSAIAYYLLRSAIIAEQGPASTLRTAVGRDWKGKASPAIYAAAIGLAFVDRWVALALYVSVALLWLVPDRRMERVLARSPEVP